MQTRFPSLVVGVKSVGLLSRLTYRGARAPVPAQNASMKLFDTVFAGVPGDPAQAERIRAQKRSVIDAVAGELGALTSRVPASDRPKIEAHLERLRAIELRLGSEKAPTGCSPAA